MDKEFSSALHKAIDIFGKDIVKEKRFVDIVSDYYPAMAVDHPAWKKVLTAIIVEGFGNDILACNNSVDTRICVEKYTEKVSKKNGFDKKLVESILQELCSVLSIAVAFPSHNRPIRPISPQPKKKKPTNSGMGKNSPTHKPINPIKFNKARKVWNFIVIIISFLISLIGLFGSITMLYDTYFSDQIFNRELYLDNITLSILTLVLSLFALICVISIVFTKSPISTKDNRKKNLIINLLTIILIIECFLPYVTYGVKNHVYKTKNYDALSLSQSRQKTDHRLAFKGIFLGEDWSNVSKKIYSDTTWYWQEAYSGEKSSTKIDTSEYDGSIYLYTEPLFTQPMMKASTTLDGESSYVNFYLINNVVAAISVHFFETEDSIVKMYSQKYGKAEESYTLLNELPSFVDLFIYQRWWKYKTGSIDHYQWTVGKSHIIYNPDYHYYNNIFYISDIYYKYSALKKKEKSRKINEKIKRDSLKRARQLNEEIKAQEKQEENVRKEHQRTINDI